MSLNRKDYANYKRDVLKAVSVYTKLSVEDVMKVKGLEILLEFYYNKDYSEDSSARRILDTLNL